MKDCEKLVFVTVGTTKFELLIDAVTKLDLLLTLRTKGFKNMIIQIGAGDRIPNLENAELAGINLHYYTYKDSILEDIMKADMIISHAGAGTCLEVLEAKKPLLVVINEQLMQNHQKELAEQLASEGYLYACSCFSLHNTVKNLDLSLFNKLQPVVPDVFSNYLNELMGLNESYR